MLNKINFFLQKYPFYASTLLTLVVIILSLLLSFFVPTLRKIMLEDLQLNFIIFLTVYFLLMLIRSGLLLFVIVPYIIHLPHGKKTLREYIRDIKLVNIHPLARNVLIGLLAVTILKVLLEIFPLLNGTLEINLNSILGAPQEGLNNEPDQLGWFSFFIYFVPSFFEEVLHRGIILTLLLNKYSQRKALVYSSLIFGLAHLSGLFFHQDLVYAVYQVIFTTAFGLAAGYIFIKTDSLLPPIIFHYFNNLLARMIHWSTEELLWLHQLNTIVAYAIFVVIIIIITNKIIKGKNTLQYT
ncbi:MAG: lysostaphin resistance A-like protein [Candidatus Hermodarchaeota archaeon]